MKKIKVDVVSDVACPWCYIGKVRLERAIDQLKDAIQFEVCFQPFQLDPYIPQDGKSWLAYFEGKFGDISNIDTMFARVESVGKTLDIPFAFRKIPRIPNTLRLHMLLDQAQREGIQPAVAKDLFDAYMVSPKDLTQPEVLLEMMSAYGWSPEKTKAVLADMPLKEYVQSRMAHYRQLGVSGVPFFIINDEYGLSGAQPEEVLIQAFNTMATPLAVERGDSCDLEAGTC